MSKSHEKIATEKQTNNYLAEERRDRRITWIKEEIASLLMLVQQTGEHSARGEWATAASRNTLGVKPASGDWERDWVPSTMKTPEETETTKRLHEKAMQRDKWTAMINDRINTLRTDRDQLLSGEQVNEIPEDPLITDIKSTIRGDNPNGLGGRK